MEQAGHHRVIGGVGLLVVRADGDAVEPDRGGEGAVVEQLDESALLGDRRPVLLVAGSDDAGDLGGGRVSEDGAVERIHDRLEVDHEHAVLGGVDGELDLGPDQPSRCTEVRSEFAFRLVAGVGREAEQVAVRQGVDGDVGLEEPSGTVVVEAVVEHRLLGERCLDLAEQLVDEPVAVRLDHVQQQEGVAVVRTGELATGDVRAGRDALVVRVERLLDRLEVGEEDARVVRLARD